MKAFLLDRHGKGAAFRAAEVPDPVIGDDDVLIAVRAAGLNQLDAKIRSGAFKAILPYKTPLILGHDVAGTVVRVGPAVRRFAVGDEVYSRPRDGRIDAFAELIAVPEADVARKPNNITMDEAAGLPLTALTAWQVLVERSAVRPGQKVLIHAGSGGVGVVAIQLAKHLGAVVATTVSGANAALVESLGADVVIDYRNDDFAQRLSGYDVVLNSLDAKTLARSLDVLAPGGTLISISGPPDPAFASAQGLNWVLRRVLALLSLGIRRKAAARGVDYAFLFMHADGTQLERITALIEDGSIRPVLDRVFPFEAIHDAFDYLETGRARGKIVLTRQGTAS